MPPLPPSRPCGSARDRSDRVLVGEDLPRRRAHLLCAATEGVEVLALLSLGIDIIDIGKR
ncbi:hypothetical protein KEF29_11585 [Streptomyces tuirus]|uniref:Uncharacterized protein n=1 Tax=Streptomyces tuirus TaxID=68278 RepID=A0A941IZM4_9ACTN|nr:hypothetical protein [Streptomyces tuirus]